MGLLVPFTSPFPSLPLFIIIITLLLRARELGAILLTSSNRTFFLENMKYFQKPLIFQAIHWEVGQVAPSKEVRHI